jgi:hypothetical protein
MMLSVSLLDNTYAYKKWRSSVGFKYMMLWRLCVVVCFISCGQAANAQMSRSAFSSAQEAARLMGRMAAALEACRVITTRIKTRVIQKAESCNASSEQIDRLQTTMDDEQSNSKLSQCSYGSQAAAEKVLTATISKLDENIQEGNCD